jgi:hypothetical protein
LDGIIIDWPCVKRNRSDSPVHWLTILPNMNTFRRTVSEEFTNSHEQKETITIFYLVTHIRVWGGSVSGLETDCLFFSSDVYRLELSSFVKWPKCSHPVP